MEFCQPACWDPMVPSVHQNSEVAQPLQQQNHFQDRLDQPEDFAKLLKHQGDLTLVVLHANSHLELYNLYFYHCKPIINIKQKARYYQKIFFKV